MITSTFTTGNTPVGTALARYDAARGALAAARSIDEVKDVRDKVEVLRLYARQAHDIELETWAAEIKLRAQRRLGELSRELPRAPPGPGRGHKRLPDNITKRAALKAAGISTSAAHRCEVMAAIPETDFETFIAAKKAAGRPVHADEMVKTLCQARRRAAARGATNRARVLPAESIFDWHLGVPDLALGGATKADFINLCKRCQIVFAHGQRFLSDIAWPDEDETPLRQCATEAQATTVKEASYRSLDDLGVTRGRG